MSELIKIGSVGLICTPVGEAVWVAHEPLCRGLSLNYLHWREVLRDSRERGRIEYRLSLDGKDEALAGHIHYQSIPVWLQMIPASYLSHLERENPAAHAAIQIVRREGADAIRRHFFAVPPAREPSRAAPGSGELMNLDVLAEVVGHLRRQQTELAAIGDRISEVSELAAGALEAKALGSRGPYFVVLACFKFWRLPAGRDAVNNAGREIVATAKREGWHHELEKVADTGYGEINSWPAARILRWFTDRHGRCPTRKYRDMLDRIERLRAV